MKSAAPAIPKQLVKIEGTLVDPANIPTHVIVAEYIRRGGGLHVAPIPTQEVEDAYRLIAAGRNADAMELLHRTFPRLAPPSHETKIANLLSHG
ncbi:hypothetical protein ASD74_02565 [Rhizobium sp. Root564]|nr:hypothetical protein ASD74_02565 [Rhizobium sp. Root564]